MKKYWKFATGIGLVLSVVIFAFSYLQYNGIGSFWMPSIAIFLIHILVYVTAVFWFRRSQNGIVSFTDAFLICVLITVVGSLISTPATFAYASQIPQAKRNQVLDSMVEKSLYDNYFDDTDELFKEDQMRQAYENMFELNVSTILSSIGTILFMCVLGLIVALIMSRDPSSIPE